MIPYKIYPPLQLGPLELHPWGIMVTLAFIVGGALIFLQARRRQIKTEVIIDILLLVLAGSMVGSRVWVVFEYWPYFRLHLLEIFAVWQGGMAFWGGFILSLGMVWIYANKRKISFWLLADLAAPSLAIGMALGRIGNFLSGQHLGKITTLPWGIEFMGQLRHPIALYESLNAFLLFIFLMLMKPKIKREGTLFLLFLLWYSVIRFGLDFWRNDDLLVADPRYILNLTGAQIACFFIFTITLFLLIRRRNNVRTAEKNLSG